MAKQPRQERIGFYGKFQPTGVDQSGARRMQALAGLAEQVGGMAEQFGIAKAEKETPAVAAKALQESITVDESGQKVYGEIPTFKGWDSERRDALAVAGYTASLENDVTNIVDSAKLNNPTSTVEYSNIVTAAMKGLKTNLPEDAKGLAESYFNQINRTAFQGIQKEEIKINNDIALGNIETALTNANVNIVNLALEGRTEDLIQAIVNRDIYAKASIKSGILDASSYAKDMQELNVQIVEQSALGTYNSLLQDESKTRQVRIAESEEALKNLNAQDRVAIPNPINPEENITLSPDQKENLAKDLKQNIKDFKDSEIKAAEELRQADELTQITNYDLAMVTAQDETISPEQKIVSINEAEAKGNVRKEDAILLRRYVNSVKALNAVTNSQEMGDILVRVNDLNANLNYTAESRDYLSGINNIRVDIMTMRTNGNLSQADENKLNAQINNLTAAKIAGATVDIANGFSKANKQIQTQLNPDLWGTARRALFDQVELEVEELDIVNEREKNKARKDLYNKNVTTVIQNIQSSKRLQAIELVNTLTTTSMAPLVITTQAQYDALPSGAEFVENGKPYRKP